DMSGPMIEKISQSLTLTCYIPGVPISTSSSMWDWIHHIPGTDLQCNGVAGLIASQFQTRVSSCADPSRNQFSLEEFSPATAATGTDFCS
ncbi:HVM60 protein, partial [Geococcyx californianus]|nr:HVM60 protein [Geococcyx californianus]